MVAFINVALVLQATLYATSVQTSSGSTFLKSRSNEDLQQVTLEIIERTLLAELSMNSDRLKQLESDLSPIYAALPKNTYGTLEPPAVRYALHRFFVQKHGWYVKGLEPAGQTWNSSAPTSVMKSRVPAYIQSLFEQRVHGKGMELHDLAVFAATMLDFVHNEVVSDIIGLYSAFGIPTTSPASKEDVDNVIHAYIVQLVDTNASIESMHDFRGTEQYMIDEFPNYHDFKLWVEDVRHTKASERARNNLVDNGLALESVIDEAQTLNDRLGNFQDIECRTLKGALAELEYKDTGRVLLSDFYRVGLQGEFLFIEHSDYLRKLGALDEADPKHPSVIIPNYLASQANCLASTSFHSVCCIDECEGLMRHLEIAVAAPFAMPARIAELVSGLHSDTVNAPRNLSASLMSRLTEIADHHEGGVPLHGRLFAQWMHHAYPLECPYPHAAGTTAPLTPDEWMDEFGQDEMAAAEHVRWQHVQEVEGLQPKVTALPWNTKEELVVPTVKAQSTEWRMLRKVAAFAAVVALAVPFSRAAKSVAIPEMHMPEKAHLV